jgi:acetyltransferase-like isoleucine patch superfamily enzyme
VSIAERLYTTLRARTGRAPAEIDPRLPGNWLLGQTTRKLPTLVRGLVRTRSFVFLGARTSLRGKSGITWGRGVSIGRSCHIDGHATDGVVFAEASRLGDFSTVVSTSHVSHMGGGFSIGARSGLGDYVHVGCAGGVRIGADVLGGSYVSFHSENHQFADTSRPIRSQGVTHQGIVVGDDVWIGAKATFLDGAEVGDHSVVAAGAVVRGKFPPHVVIAGVPAKVVRHLDQSAAER